MKKLLIYSILIIGLSTTSLAFEFDPLDSLSQEEPESVIENQELTQLESEKIPSERPTPPPETPILPPDPEQNSEEPEEDSSTSSRYEGFTHEHNGECGCDFFTEDEMLQIENHQLLMNSSPFGTLKLKLNPTLNAPPEFFNQDIVVSVYTHLYDPFNENFDSIYITSVGAFEFTLSFDNSYNTSIELPIGDYIFMTASAEDSFAILFDLPSEPFTITEGKTTEQQIFFFDRSTLDIFKEEIPEEREESKGTVVFSHESQSETEVVTFTLKAEDGTLHNIILNQSNLFFGELFLNAGTYELVKVVSNEDEGIQCELYSFSLSGGGAEAITSIPTPLETPEETTEDPTDDNSLGILLPIAIFSVALCVGVCVYAVRIGIRKK